MTDFELEAPPVKVYEPTGPGIHFDFKEFWSYRELLYFLTWRDIKIRYKQAALGAAWAILQPVLSMVIFSVIFGRFAKLPSDGIPYPLFSLAALLPWQLFSGALSRAGNSLVSNRNLLTKVYFPRLVIPLSAVAAGLLDFGISFLVLIVLMLYYGIQLTWNILYLPLLVLFALVTAFSIGLWLSALNVKYRDVEHAIPFLIQAWLYASPVAYSESLVPAGFLRTIYGLNPMAGVIQGFRWALLGSSRPDSLMLVSVLVVLLLLVGGLIYFQKMEESFADVV